MLSTGVLVVMSRVWRVKRLRNTERWTSTCTHTRHWDKGGSHMNSAEDHGSEWVINACTTNSGVSNSAADGEKKMNVDDVHICQWATAGKKNSWKIKWKLNKWNECPPNEGISIYLCCWFLTSIFMLCNKVAQLFITKKRGFKALKTYEGP